METNHTSPRPVLPLVALLALASALGVAVAVALAGVAMLLAAPAYAQEGTLLLERRGGLAQAQRVFGEIDSDEHGHARLVEVYYNPFDDALEGVYVFRVPPNAVLERFRFSAGGVEFEPAILTLRHGEGFVERSAEIGPGETLRVELEYRSRHARRVLARYSSPS